MAAVGDGPEVGRVSIRVIPKLKRFREDVEKELRSLPEGDVKIAPDTDGFKQKVKAQTKGLKAQVDTKLNTSGLRSQAKAAAKAASGETVTFTTRTKQLGKVVSSGTEGIARRVNKQFSIMASTLRLTGSAARVAGKSFRWATGGELVNRKIVSWLVQVRDKTYEVGKATYEVGKAAGTQLARPYQAAAKQAKKYGDVAKYALDGKRNDVYSQVIRLPLAYQRAKKSARDYTDEVRRMSKGWHGHETANAEHASEQYRRVLKEMKSFYNKYAGFQRKSPEYDALNRREYNAILDLADKIRTSNTGSSRDLQELVSRANDLHTRLGIADDELQEFDKHTKDVKKSFEDLDKARTWRNLAVRLDGTKNQMRQVQNRAREMGNSVKESAQKMGNSIRESFDNSKVGPQLDKLRTSVTRLQEAVGRDTKTGNTKKALKDFFSSFKRVKGDTVQVVDSIERVTRTTGRASGAMKKMGNQASGIGKKLKGFWNNFHQPENRIFGLTEMGWMVAAITSLAAPVAGLVSGLVAALPALGGAFAAALGVGILGWEGVKEAAEAAAPAFGRAKEAMSDIARERMTPQFEQLGEVLDSLIPAMGQVGHGMADTFQGLVNAVSSEQGIGNMNTVLENTAGLFTRLKPMAENFTTGLLEAGAAGSRTFEQLGDGLADWSERFRDNWTRMANDGTFENAISSLFNVTGSLGGAIGSIFDSALEEFPRMEGMFVGLFDSIAAGAPTAISVLTDISLAVGDVISHLAGNLGTLFEGTGGQFAGIFEDLGRGLGPLTTGLADLGGVVFPPVLNLLGGITDLGADIMEDAGEALSGLAGALESHAPGIEQATERIANAMGDFWDAMFNPPEDPGAAPVPGGADGKKGPLDFIGWVAETYIHDIQSSRHKVDQAAAEAFGTPIEVEPEVTINPQLTINQNIDAMSASMMGPIADIQATVDQFKVNAEEVAGQLDIDISPQIRVLEDAEGIAEAQSAAQNIVESLRTAAEGTPAEVKPDITVDPSAADGAGDGVGSAVESEINSALQGLDIDTSGAAASIGSDIGAAFGGVSIPSGALADQLTNTISEAITAASATFEELTTAASTAGTSAADGFTEGFGVIVEQASGKAGEAKGAVEGQLSGINLFSSGRAAGNSFANGLTASIATVAAAAAAVAAAARGHFPNSPAKVGPFSGSNYVDRSGMAVAKDFAKGMESEIGAVEAAAGAVTGAARGKFDDFMVAPAGNMEAFKRQEILTPVLESNAQTIRNWRDRDAEMVEQHYERLAKNQENYQERVADIQARDSKQASKDKSLASQRENLAKNNAKAEEQLAERRAEAKQKMLDSLEAPEYRDIERSFRAYWLDGASNVIEEGLVDSMNEARIAERMKGLALRTVQRVRETFGNHPMLETVEASVQAEHFADTLERVFRESGIAEIPVNLVLANYDQLKSDLGMQDGVISRAMDAAIDYDPSATDARYARQNAVEIHYHVEDMEDAIRLEQQRERKEMLKIK